MIRIFLAAVDAVLAAVILIPVFLLLYCTVYHRDLKKAVLYCLFCLYMAAVFSLVGIPNVTYVRPSLNLNVIPFLGMVNDLKNSLLNIALFVPFGCFLPTLWSRYRQLLPAITLGLGVSVLIELLQMLTFRATDVNDLITNVLGTTIGFLIARPLSRKYPQVEKGSGHVYALIFLSFCVMFFIHPFLSHVIWDRIL